jgi:fatty-acyl-CoA synthase
MMALGGALVAGGTLVISRRFSAKRFWSDCAQHDVTSIQYIGELCRYLLNAPRHPDEDRHKIRVALGNGLRPEVWGPFKERFGIPRIVEFYGATEGNTALINFEGKPGAVGQIPHSLRKLMGLEILRFDIESEEVLRDEDGHCLRAGLDEAGELVGKITKTTRFEGYTNSEATEKKILRDVFKKGDTWFRTGDLLRCDADGYFYFVDRIGDTFRWKGENVSTQEVAEALCVVPGVEVCNVYGIEVPGQEGRAGMAAMVLADPASFDGAAIYELVQRSLPSYAAPVFLRVQGEAEMTGTLKLRKVDLAKEGYDPSVIKDPLYVRDDAARAYVPLTAARLAALHAGELRV